MALVIIESVLIEDENLSAYFEHSLGEINLKRRFKLISAKEKDVLFWPNVQLYGSVLEDSENALPR